MPLLLALTSAPGSSQEPARVRAHLSVRLHWSKVEYGRQYVDGEAVVLRGEPILLELNVANLDTKGPETTWVEADWRNRIAIRLRDGRADDRGTVRPVSCAFVAHSAIGVRQSADMLILPRGAQIVEVCRLVIEPGQLSTVNMLEVDWSEQADGTRLRDILARDRPRRLRFEYRDIITEEDALDLALHRARRAIDEGRPQQALAMIEYVMQVEPLSTTAFVVRARARSMMADCRGAEQDYEMAARISENQSDIRNKLIEVTSRVVDGYDARRAASYLRAQAMKAGCK